MRVPGPFETVFVLSECHQVGRPERRMVWPGSSPPVSLFVLGQRLFDDGGSVALEAMIDAIEQRLGRDRAVELVRIWKSVIEGENLAA